MESRAKLAGHAIHPMLVVFPLGLLATAFIFDMIHLYTGDALWATMSYWLIAGGVIGGFAAAPFGTIDWLGIPDGTRAKSIGLIHGLGNVIVLGFFAASWFLRRGNVADPGTVPIVLAGVGVLMSVAAAWMGGELVERLGVGVDPGAHVDAPSSLSGLPASATVETEERRAA